MQEQGGDAPPNPEFPKPEPRRQPRNRSREPETPPGEMSEKIQSWKEALAEPQSPVGRFAGLPRTLCNLWPNRLAAKTPSGTNLPMPEPVSALASATGANRPGSNDFGPRAISTCPRRSRDNKIESLRSGPYRRKFRATCTCLGSAPSMLPPGSFPHGAGLVGRTSGGDNLLPKALARRRGQAQDPAEASLVERLAGRSIGSQQPGRIDPRL